MVVEIKRLRPHITDLHSQIAATPDTSRQSNLRSEVHNASRQLRDLKQSVRASAATCIQRAWTRARVRPVETPKTYFPFGVSATSCSVDYRMHLSMPPLDATLTTSRVPLLSHPAPTSASVSGGSACQPRYGPVYNAPARQCGVCVAACACGMWSTIRSLGPVSSACVVLPKEHYDALAPAPLAIRAGEVPSVVDSLQGRDDGEGLDACRHGTGRAPRRGPRAIDPDPAADPAAPSSPRSAPRVLLNPLRQLRLNIWAGCGGNACTCSCECPAHAADGRAGAGVDRAVSSDSVASSAMSPPSLSTTSGSASTSSSSQPPEQGCGCIRHAPRVVTTPHFVHISEPNSTASPCKCTCYIRRQRCGSHPFPDIVRVLAANDGEAGAIAEAVAAASTQGLIVGAGLWEASTAPPWLRDASRQGELLARLLRWYGLPVSPVTAYALHSSAPHAPEATTMPALSNVLLSDHVMRTQLVCGTGRGNTGRGVSKAVGMFVALVGRVGVRAANALCRSSYADRTMLAETLPWESCTKTTLEAHKAGLKKIIGRRQTKVGESRERRREEEAQDGRMGEPVVVGLASVGMCSLAAQLGALTEVAETERVRNKGRGGAQVNAGRERDHARVGAGAAAAAASLPRADLGAPMEAFIGSVNIEPDGIGIGASGEDGKQRYRPLYAQYSLARTLLEQGRSSTPLLWRPSLQHSVPYANVGDEEADTGSVLFIGEEQLSVLLEGLLVGADADEFFLQPLVEKHHELSQHGRTHTSYSYPEARISAAGGGPEDDPELLDDLLLSEMPALQARPDPVSCSWIAAPHVHTRADITENQSSGENKKKLSKSAFSKIRTRGSSHGVFTYISPRADLDSEVIGRIMHLFHAWSANTGRMTAVDTSVAAAMLVAHDARRTIVADPPSSPPSSALGQSSSLLRNASMRLEPMTVEMEAAHLDNVCADLPVYPGTAPDHGSRHSVVQAVKWTDEEMPLLSAHPIMMLDLALQEEDSWAKSILALGQRGAALPCRVQKQWPSTRLYTCPEDAPGAPSSGRVSPSSRKQPPSTASSSASSTAPSVDGSFVCVDDEAASRLILRLSGYWDALKTAYAASGDPGPASSEPFQSLLAPATSASGCAECDAMARMLAASLCYRVAQEQLGVSQYASRPGMSPADADSTIAGMSIGDVHGDAAAETDCGCGLSVDGELPSAHADPTHVPAAAHSVYTCPCGWHGELPGHVSLIGVGTVGLAAYHVVAQLASEDGSKHLAEGARAGHPADESAVKASSERVVTDTNMYRPPTELAQLQDPAQRNTFAKHKATIDRFQRLLNAQCHGSAGHAHGHTHGHAHGRERDGKPAKDRGREDKDAGTGTGETVAAGAAVPVPVAKPESGSAKKEAAIKPTSSSAAMVPHPALRPVPAVHIPAPLPAAGSAAAARLLTELRKEKRELQVELNIYEREFEKVHGRKIRFQHDVKPVEGQWQRYRDIKSTLLTLGDDRRKEA